MASNLFVGIDVDEDDDDEVFKPSKVCWLVAGCLGGMVMCTHISQDYPDFRDTCEKMRRKHLQPRYRKAPHLSKAWEWEANLSLSEAALWAHYVQGVPANVAQ